MPIEQNERHYLIIIMMMMMKSTCVHPLTFANSAFSFYRHQQLVKYRRMLMQITSVQQLVATKIWSGCNFAFASLLFHSLTVAHCIHLFSSLRDRSTHSTNTHTHMRTSKISTAKNKFQPLYDEMMLPLHQVKCITLFMKWNTHDEGAHCV